MSVADLRARFRELHAREQLFVMPNPWDVGSARLLEKLGFEALATTSAGFAWSLGKSDQTVTRDDLDDTISRLLAYRDAGADCVYAPFLKTLDQIRTVVDALGVPVNVLALPVAPSTAELASVGVRRVSTGGSLARAAYSAFFAGAQELHGEGTSTYVAAAPGNASFNDLLGT